MIIISRKQDVTKQIEKEIKTKYIHNEKHQGLSCSQCLRNVLCTYHEEEDLESYFLIGATIS